MTKPLNTLRRLEKAAMRWYREWCRDNPDGEAAAATKAEIALINACFVHHAAAKGKRGKNVSR